MAYIKKQKKKSIHRDLAGFDILVDQFGAIKTTFSIDKLNLFLDKNVEDKKLNNLGNN